MMHGSDISRTLALVLSCGLVWAGGCSSSQHTSDADSDSSVEAPINDTAMDPSSPSSSETTRVTRATAGSGQQVVSAAFPTGDASTSAIMLERIYPMQVNANQEFSYDMRVTNLTGLALDEVTVRDTLPSNFDMAGSTPRAMTGADGQTVWTIGTLGPRESQTITVRGEAGSVGTITSCASVTYAQALCAEIVVVSPDLELVMTAPEAVMLCDTIPLTYTVSNPGSGTAEGVRITQELPAGMTTESGSRTVSFSVPALGPNQSQTFSVMARAEETGEFRHSASASAEGDLSADANRPTTVVMQPVLEVTASAPRMTFVGRNVSYEFEVTNTGDGVAANTMLVGNLPSGAEFVRASNNGTQSGGRVNWALGDLAPGASRTVSFTVAGNVIGQQQASVEATAICSPAAQDNVRTEVAGIPAVLLEVIDVQDPIEVGSNVTYQITVTNQGSAPDTNIRIVAEFEDVYEFVSAGGATAGTARGRTIEFQPYAQLDAKESITFTVTLRAIDEGDTRFRVQMRTDELGRPVEETEATNLYR